ncbi:DUF5682 family protein [Streptomyces sp. NPDC005863]|uniref:DUF5682 family protein n=1 Tax=unclassified Streptomyces TaxID=2593676 RepID=UPI0033FF2A42
MTNAGEHVTNTGARGANAREPLLLGVRHHGPGSARAVSAALDVARPDVLLVEGPPEADALVGLAADEGMRPPVALLAHVVDEPGRSAFWPLAEFSPEWVAIRWALGEGVPVRFIDLPAAHSLALRAEEELEEEGRAEEGRGGEGRGGEGRDGRRGEGDVRIDPVAVLAETAGYDDPERWWEDVVEHRGTGGGRGGRRGEHLGASGEQRGMAGGGRGTGGEQHGADGGRRGTGGERRGTRDEHLGTSNEHRGTDGEHLGARGEHLGAGGERLGTSGEPHRAESDCRHLGASGERRGTGGEHLRVRGEEHGAGGGFQGVGGDVFAPFEVLGEAMEALREVYGDGGHGRDLVREAYMRLQMRAAAKEFGAGRVAVVCGAWHVPALRRTATVAADRALLKGLPKVKAEMTWVPWTHRRLSRASGYGAGIASPGWYGHLFAAPDRPIERWMTKVAGLLRDEDRLVSSAHVIEAVRLADTLAAMRGRPLAGLTETTDAVRAVMCEGSDVPLALVHDKLVVGDVLGEVPEAAPAVPLQRDLTRLQRRLRLKPEALERELELDLRKETDAARSRLLHRLRLLGIGWGEPAVSRGSTGTFRETWRLRWEPELSVRVAEAGVWGTTVLGAATGKAASDAVEARALADVTALAERCLLAELPDALPVVMRVLADRAALDTDVGHLAQALPALVRSLRYGDVRGTGTEALGEVALGLAERIFVGLPPACAGLDADAALEMRGHVDAVHRAVGLLGELTPAEPALAGAVPAGGVAARGVRVRWASVLRALGQREGVAGVVRGRCVRLLLDGGDLGDEEVARLMGLALSRGSAPAEGAAWIEGFVGGGTGGGMLLVHDTRLLGLVDDWLCGVSDDAFTDVLPLLRRTFSAYEPGVRRTLGELIRRGPARTGAGTSGGAGAPGSVEELDAARADAVVPVVHLLLGLSPGAGASEPYAAAPHGAAPHGATPHGATPYGAAPYGATPVGARTPDGTTYGSELMEVTG